MNTKELFKIDDRVFDYSHGWGTVRRIIKK